MSLFSKYNLRFYNFTRPNSHPDKSFFKSKLLIHLITVRPHVKLYAILIGFVGAIIGILPAWFQKLFIQTLSSGKFIDQIYVLFFYIFCTFICSLCFQFLMSVCRLICSRENLIAQGWLSQEIYLHTLSLAPKVRGKKTVGETVSLYATDIQLTCFVIEDSLPTLIATIIPLIIAPFAVTYITKISLWQPITISLLSVFTCIIFAIKQAKFLSKAKLCGEKRISIVNEWIQNIKGLRTLGWIQFFESKIRYAREEETQNRLGMVTNGSTMNSIMQVAPQLINVAGVVSLLNISSNNITPGDIFSILWIFGIFLTRPLRMFPWAIVKIIDGYTSAKRLENYFNFSSEQIYIEKNNIHHTEVIQKTLNPAFDYNHDIIIENLLLKSSGTTLLNIPSLQIPSGRLVAIVGEVGTGKTLFLKSLMRESWCTFAKYTIGNVDALTITQEKLKEFFVYIPQEPFVMNSSLRDNISLTYGTDDIFDIDILKSLSLAQLPVTPDNFESGLNTQIGERGVNLSGGQKQRVNLARAYYHNSPIVMMDDALSALDVITETRVRDELLLGAWKSFTRILVTHRFSILPYCDTILFFDEGQIIAQGTLKELQAHSTLFNKFMSS